jgi:hypothetical protein
MSDFDSETEKTVPGRSRSDVAFREAMTGVQTRCNQLKATIDSHDLEGVARTVDSAVDFWLGGQVACRRLIASSRAASPYVCAARELIETLYVKLLEFLTLATTTIEVPWLHGRLAQARAKLVAAMREPLSPEAEASTAGSSSGATS